MNRQRQRLWWATWPGALALGVASLAMVLPGVLALIGTALLPVDDSAGIDVEVSGPGTLVRVVAATAGAAALGLPVLSVRWARRRWLGYLLLGLSLSAVVGAVGLGMMGIL